jgi:hypothetical protein
MTGTNLCREGEAPKQAISVPPFRAGGTDLIGGPTPPTEGRVLLSVHPAQGLPRDSHLPYRVGVSAGCCRLTHERVGRFSIVLTCVVAKTLEHQMKIGWRAM